jgi:hypothetical protein
MADPGKNPFMSEQEAEEIAQVQRIRDAIDSGRLSPHEAVWRERQNDNYELVKMNEEKAKAARAAKAESGQQQEAKEEQAPEPEPARRELPFFEQKARNYDELKQEHADAQSSDAKPEKGEEQAQGKTLAFHEDHNHDPQHSR